MLQNALLYTDGEDRNITAWNIKSGKVAYCVRKKMFCHGNLP